MCILIMVGYIGPMTNSFLDKIIKELKKKKTRDKIVENIIDPVISDVIGRYYPYMVTISMVFLVIIILLCIILYTNISRTSCENCSKRNNCSSSNID
jgi:hypothetical protein